MWKSKILLASIALLLSALACTTLFGEETSPQEEPNFVTEEPEIQEANPEEELVSCPLLTDEIIEIATSASESDLEALDEEILLVTYFVDNDEISDPLYEEVSDDFQDEQANQVVHQEVWDYFTSIIPLQNRGMIEEYAIITDGVDNTLAAVSQTQTDPQTWSLQVDIADTSDYYNLTFTLIHEYGHLLTLEPNQVPPSLAIFNNPDDDDIFFQESAACPYYFPGEGCPHADSYINAFYENFWGDIYEEWNEINLEEDDDIYYEKLDAFYQKYEDQFVTDYAVTNPAEDIAESWAFFVLSPESAGDTIAEEKTLFFYNYPELVQLRSEILNNICTAFP